MRAFDAAWDLLKSIQNFQSFAPEQFVSNVKRTFPYAGRYDARYPAGTKLSGYDRALNAGNTLSMMAERNAISDILDEMGIPLAGGGFANAGTTNHFYSPLQRDPDGSGNYRNREQRGLPPATLQEQLAQYNYYAAIDPQNDYTMQEHFAQYPTSNSIQFINPNPSAFIPPNEGQ
jgi:hypothetical protein